MRSRRAAVWVIRKSSGEAFSQFLQFFYFFGPTKAYAVSNLGYNAAMFTGTRYFRLGGDSVNQKFRAAAVLLILMLAAPLASLAATLKVGDKAPDFTLPDQNGKKVKLSDFLGKKN